MKRNVFENDRGETSTQTVIIVPVVLTVLFLAVHLAIIGHASHVAQVAAERGAQIAAASNGSVSGLHFAMKQASDVVHDMGAHLGAAPTVQLSGKTVGVTVRLVTQKLVPFLPSTVSRTVWVAREEFVKEQDR